MEMLFSGVSQNDCHLMWHRKFVENEPQLMSQLSTEEKNRMFDLLEQHTVQNEKIERGLYGDKPNNVKGALEQITDLRKDLKNVQGWIDAHNLRTAYISGCVAACIVGVKGYWDYIFKKQ